MGLCLDFRSKERGGQRTFKYIFKMGNKLHNSHHCAIISEENIVSKTNDPDRAEEGG